MATVGVVRVGLTADAERFKAGLLQARLSLRKFGASTATAAASLAGFAIKAGVAGAAAGAMAIGIGSVKSALDVQKDLLGLSKATDLTGESLQAVKQDVYDLATTLPGVDLHNLFEIATLGGKLGVGREDLKAFTEGVAKVSIAIDDLEPAFAAEQIAKLLNVFGEGPSKAINLGSAIDRLADSSTASAADILDISKRMSGFMSVMGGSITETIALATAMQDAGVNVEVAASSINRILGIMADEQGIVKFAESVGIAASDMKAAFADSPLAAIQLFLSGFSQLSGTAQFGVLQEIGLDAKLAQAAILQLGTVTGKLGEFASVAAEDYRTLAKVEASVAAQAGSVSAKWAVFQNQIDIFGATLGETVVPLLNDALASTNDWLSANQDGFKNWSESAVEANGAITNSIGILGETLAWTVDIIDLVRGAFSTMQVAETIAMAEMINALQEYAVPLEYVLDALTGTKSGLSEKMQAMTDDLWKLSAEQNKAATELGTGKNAAAAREFFQGIQARIVAGPDKHTLAKLIGGPGYKKGEKTPEPPKEPKIPTIDTSAFTEAVKPEPTIKSQLGGALAYGSAEARTAILNARLGARDEQIKLQREQVELQRQMVRALEGSSASPGTATVVEFM